MSRSNELDLLNSDTHRWLDDVTILIEQHRPQSVIDPTNRTRAINAGSKHLRVAASEGLESKLEINGRWVRIRSWFVDAAVLGFEPSRQALVTDGDGIKWRLTKVERRNGGREYELFAELLG